MGRFDLDINETGMALGEKQSMIMSGLILLGILYITFIGIILGIEIESSRISLATGFIIFTILVSTAITIKYIINFRYLAREMKADTDEQLAEILDRIIYLEEALT